MFWFSIFLLANQIIFHRLVRRSTFDDLKSLIRQALRAGCLEKLNTTFSLKGLRRRLRAPPEELPTLPSTRSRTKISTLLTIAFWTSDRFP